MFACSGENLTSRFRSQAFRAILRQEIDFFDKDEHNTGILCTRLGTDASAIQNGSGIRFGFFCQNFVTTSLSIIIGLVYSWQLTLLITPFIALMIAAIYFQICVTAAFEEKDREFINECGKV